MTLFLLVFAAALGFAYINGFHDTANAIATVISTKVLTPRAAFVFIGLDPNTAFLRGSIDLDARGFVDDKGGFTTSMPGVFAAGDVRRGSTKQLGSAVGDGIAALIAIREYLQEHHEVARHPED